MYEKLYNLELEYTSVYGYPTETQLKANIALPGMKICLNKPVYYNDKTGILFTEGGAYQIISYEPGQYNRVKNYIEEVLEEVWKVHEVY